MAYFSKPDILSDKQAITATAVSSNVIDFGDPGQWIHAKAPHQDDKGRAMIPLFIQVTEDFDNLTSLKIGLEFSDAEDFSASDMLHEQTLALKVLKAGQRTNIRFIPDGAVKRYMRIKYTVTGTTPTTGRVLAAIATEGELK